MSLLNDPMHPGEVLQTLYLEPLGWSAITCARHIQVPRSRIERLLRGETAMTPDTALRLARAFETTPAYWMAMQVNHDLARAARVLDMPAIAPARVVTATDRPRTRMSG